MDRGILLAAGVGKRLKPLTDKTPKPLLEVGGKPILQWVLEGLRSAGIIKVAIIVGHLGEQIEDYFGDGHELGLELSFHEQTLRDGTARAVLPAREFLEGHAFFLGYGDIIVDPENYKTMVKKFHEYSDSSILGAWAVKDPSIGGALKIKDGLLVDLIEKPAPGTEPSNLINAGLMVFQPQIIDHILKVKPSERGEYELTDAILSLAKESPFRVHELTNFWSDVGTHDKLAETHEWLLKKSRPI